MNVCVCVCVGERERESEDLTCVPEQCDVFTCL